MPWKQYSESKLINAEQKILSNVKSKYTTRFVNIKWEKDKNEKIWTISLNTNSDSTPLVLLHGFGSGLALWIHNLDLLSKDRPVYAIDILGFARSSRPKFSEDSMKAEQQLIDSIEAWRIKLKLDKFILLGHSMGGYLATLYGISYPKQIKYLILADPWGFGDKSQSPPRKSNICKNFLNILLFPLTLCNPLATIRACGPLGPGLVKKLRADITNKYENILDDNSIIPDYIFNCNAQNPTGETAFHQMMQGIGWAKNPMIHRIQNMSFEIPIKFLYGSNTWIDTHVASRVKEIRPRSSIEIEVIEGAGHHIYADQADKFNEIVTNTCLYVDSKESI